jgi:hypothetical protein
VRSEGFYVNEKSTDTSWDQNINMEEMSFYMQMKGIDYWAVRNLSEPLIFQVQNK